MLEVTNFQILENVDCLLALRCLTTIISIGTAVVCVVRILSTCSIPHVQECHLLVLNASGQVTSRVVLHPSVDSSGYIVKVGALCWDLGSNFGGMRGEGDAN